MPPTPRSLVKFAAQHSGHRRAARSVRRRRATRCPTRCKPIRARAACRRPRWPCRAWPAGRRGHPEAAAPAQIVTESARARCRRGAAAASGFAAASRRSKISSSHSPVRTFSSCVVDAFVVSPVEEPHSALWQRSGIISSRAAAAGRPASACAMSWKTVLNGRNWMPVLAKDRFAFHRGADTLHHARRPRVPVADRILDQRLRIVDEPVIDPPRVDADRGAVAGPRAWRSPPARRRPVRIPSSSRSKSHRR